MHVLPQVNRDMLDILTWVRNVASEPEEPRILNDKGWSVVIHLGAAVLKVTAPGVFPEGPRMFDLVGRAAPGLVPDLLAWRVGEGGRHEMLFRPFEGIAIDDQPVTERREGLVTMASTFGKIQARLAEVSPADLTTVSPRDIPTFLDELLEGAVSICKRDYADQWSQECSKQSVSEELVAALRPWRGAVAEWAAELLESGDSNGVDHVDLLPHNAQLLPNGECIVYDWEQATLGVPLFSLDVLLAYAQSVDEGEDGLVLGPERTTQTQERIRSAYTTEQPGPLDLALRLAPVRYCWAEWNQAVASGVPHFAVDDVAWWMTRALRRWERL